MFKANISNAVNCTECPDPNHSTEVDDATDVSQCCKFSSVYKNQIAKYQLHDKTIYMTVLDLVMIVLQKYTLRKKKSNIPTFLRGAFPLLLITCTQTSEYCERTVNNFGMCFFKPYST